jgi:hypothetical protein
MKEVEQVRNRLQAIAADLDAGNYRLGSWQAVIADADELPMTEKQTLAPEITKLSRQLHGRHGFVNVGFRAGYAVELILLIVGSFAILADSLVTNLIGVFCFALCLQPLMKISFGLILGVRYDYVYLWYIEPRFKMQYGSYFLLTHAQRVLLNLFGSFGTPIAMLIGFITLTPHHAWLGNAALILFVVATLMQIAAFVAEWMGVRMLGPFRLSQLTSPATAAAELKKHRRKV